MRSFGIVSLLVLAGACQSTGAHEARTSLDGARSKAAFEQMKSLVGEWKGVAGNGGENHELTTTFALTGAGTSLVETMFKGSPHEMVTVYHMDGDALRLTHYCAAGNQPRMVATRNEGGSTLCFDFAGASNLASPNDMHMHEAKIHIIDSEHVESWWTAWANGKADHTAHFAMQRVSAR